MQFSVVCTFIDICIVFFKLTDIVVGGDDVNRLLILPQERCNSRGLKLFFRLTAVNICKLLLNIYQTAHCKNISL